MDVNQRFFIRILADHIDHRNTALVDDIDWNVISCLSSSHDVDGIVFYQCKGFIPAEYYKQYEELFGLSVFESAKRKREFVNVQGLLKSADIPFFTVKGFNVAEYYPVPVLRTMGDCDIIVNQGDMARTMTLMRALGYEGIDNERADSWGCRRGDFLFEFHDKLVEDGEFPNINQNVFFNNWDEYVHNEKLDWNMQFLFLLMHLRKHFINSGVGIRQFMDLAILIKSNIDFEWDWIEKKLIELDLLRFAQSCFSLLDAWFDVKAPVEYSSFSEGFLDEVTQIVLSNGVFGHNNKDNIGNYERNLIISSKGHIIYRRFKVLILNAFPPYDYMRKYPGCGFVEENHFLLPAAWVKRYLQYLRRSDRKSARRILEGTMSDKNTLNARKELLDKMGI